jgi:hypothetical protein
MSVDPTYSMPGAFDSYQSAAKTPRGPLALFSSITQRIPKTPKDRTPIKPTGIEMHPQLHHKSTSTPHDEARWLGFFNMGSQTAPAKATAGAVRITSPTPIKVVAAPTKTLDAPPAPPKFEFTFARRVPSLELSAEAKQLMAESREQAEKIRAQMVAALPSVPEGDPSEGTSGRKIAKPKGKTGRYSDVHLASFKKMDSIANHPSSWRADSSRAQPSSNALKRSPSKVELVTSATQSLKRSPSKAELDVPAPPTLMRSPSKIGLYAATSTLKRSPSKAQLDKPEDSPFMSKMPVKVTTGRQQNEEPTAGPAKRVKRDSADDAGKARPISGDSGTKLPVPRTPSVKRLQRFHIGSQPTSRAMTPTKASLARSQSVKNLRAVQSMIPSLARSQSIMNLYQPQTPRRSLVVSPIKVASPTPAKVGVLNNDAPVKAPTLLKSLPSVTKPHSPVKSILRTPHRLYSKDPAKIAAGTHMATPPDAFSAFSPSPAPTTVRKHVDFTASTKLEAEQKTDCTISAGPTVSYPILPSAESPDACTPPSAKEEPSTFTFRSDNIKSFDSIQASSTIRPVRSSDAGLPTFFPSPSPQKRKIDILGNIYEREKENEDEEDEGEARGAKKARKDEPELLVRSPAKKSRLPQRNTAGKRPGGLSAARLHMLATPKHR